MTYTEGDFLRDKEHLRRLEQQEYTLWQQLEQAYRELANLKSFILLSTEKMENIRKNQQIVQNNLQRYEELEASEFLTPLV